MYIVLLEQVKDIGDPGEIFSSYTFTDTEAIDLVQRGIARNATLAEITNYMSNALDAQLNLIGGEYSEPLNVDQAIARASNRQESKDILGKREDGMSVFGATLLSCFRSPDPSKQIEALNRLAGESAND